MSEDMNQIRLLDDIQTAEFLGLQPATLALWRVKKKGPPFVRISANCVRYRVQDLKEWIDSKIILKMEAEAA